MKVSTDEVAKEVAWGTNAYSEEPIISLVAKFDAPSDTSIVVQIFNEPSSCFSNDDAAIK